MVKILYALLLSFLIFSNHCSAEIIMTEDVRVIESYLDALGEDTLVIFDVDDVLMQAKDQLLKSQNKKYLQEMQKEMEARLGRQKQHELGSLVLLQRAEEPVDEKMIKIIQKTQERCIKVLALTNCFTGPFGTIKAMEEWRVSELKSLGYEFQKSWLKVKDKTFKKIQLKKGGPFPCFTKGVLFACDVPKGDVLQAFLEYVSFLPDEIIFIDDKIKYLQSGEVIAQKFGIRFLGIQYTAVKNAKQEPLNKERAQLQIKTLEKENRLLSDKEADLYGVKTREKNK